MQRFRFITEKDLFGNKEEEDFEKKAESAFRKETFLDAIPSLAFLERVPDYCILYAPILNNL